MRKASSGMLEKGILTPSPSPDLIPAGNKKTLAENLHGNWNIERGHVTSSIPNQCHANVEQYVHTHPGCQPVRGWLVEEFESFTYFNAHSVVRLETGSLADITPVNRDCPFILHMGPAEEFERIRHKWPRVEYPPIDFNSLGDCAPVEDPNDEPFG